MVPITEFDKISFRKPFFNRFARPLEKIVGFDSEAYTTGETFLFCTSKGEAISPDNLIETLFTDTYAGSNFVTWNLKYESGAILKCLPHAVIKELQQNHTATLVYKEQKYRISYIPHKRLKIKQMKFSGKSVRFWDMSPFYGRRKLDIVARDYLRESKDDVDTEQFTPSYVLSNFEKIVAYCVQDAVLTCKLAVLWIEKFQQTGISVTSLYSEASISFDYIVKKAEVVTLYEYWDNSKKLFRLAFESYEGGKFEITSRGRFTAYEYDISSAYPFEIANLVDIRNSHIEYSKSYHSEALYGFLRVRISFSDPDLHLPCGIFRKLRLYPIGTYYLTITKQEYDYILSELPSVSVDILDAAWIIVSRRRYPYREIFTELYELKTKWKPTDRLRSNNYKIIMNGFYGKMAQCLLSTDGSYNAGRGWNPVYASIITANTRIAVTRLQNLLKDDCIAVHTDSVMTTVPLPGSFTGSGFGDFEQVEYGDTILVACGIYEINGLPALKGFRRHSVKQILEENPGKAKITFTTRHVESWLQAMAQNHDPSSINVFSDKEKILTLNCDTKRSWPKNVCTDDLLNSSQKSFPLIEQQNFLPKYWKE